MHYQIKNNIIQASSIRLVQGRFNIFFYAFFCPGTMTTDAESMNSDLLRGLIGQTFTRHTTLNTEQNQLAIKVSADN